MYAYKNDPHYKSTDTRLPLYQPLMEMLFSNFIYQRGDAFFEFVGLHIDNDPLPPYINYLNLSPKKNCTTTDDVYSSRILKWWRSIPKKPFSLFCSCHRQTEAREKKGIRMRVGDDNKIWKSYNRHWCRSAANSCVLYLLYIYEVYGIQSHTTTEVPFYTSQIWTIRVKEKKAVRRLGNGWLCSKIFFFFCGYGLGRLIEKLETHRRSATPNPYFCAPISLIPL